MPTTEHIIKKLRVQGERVTGVRRAILEILATAKQPLSSDEIGAALGKRRLVTNKTTVYRQLESLARLGVVQMVRLGDRPARFELESEATTHHHHLICTACGKIEDVALPGDLAKYEQAIARRKKFRVLRHSLEFFGLCGTCK